MSHLPAIDDAPEINAFRQQVRDWIAKNWTPAQRAEYAKKPFKDRGWDRDFSKKLGRDHWIGLGWPKEFGGQGRSPSEVIAYITEMANAEAPVQAHNVAETIVGPALMHYGTPEQQAEWLPKILAGEIY